MKRWFISTFMKKHAVRIYILYPDNRVKDYWILHKNKPVIALNGNSYSLTKEHMVLKGNVPTYFFNYEDCEALCLDPRQTPTYSPEDLGTALQSHVARDIIMSTNKGAFSTEFFITLGLIFLGFMATIYLMNDKFTELQTQIQGDPETVLVEGE